MVIEDVEDLDVGAAGELPMGDVELPALVGLLGLEADVAAFGAFVRLGVTKPRAERIRQIVDTAGLTPWRR